MESRQMEQHTGEHSNTPDTTAVSEPQVGPIQLTPQRLQMIGVTMGTVERKSMAEEIRATGTVEVNERRVAFVQTRFPGWVRQVFADATYEYIRKGQPLFTVYSPDLVTTEQEYLLSKKNAEKLQQSSVAGVASGAESLLSAARQRLEQWEVPQSEIAKVEATGKPITELTFNSPVSGYITERNALPNMYVQPETRLYTVADLSNVWVNAQVFQNDIGKLAPGNTAEVTVDAYPGRTFNGRIEQILPQVDMTTRTVRVRLAFSNPGLKLKPGMYVNVLLKSPMGKYMVVPASAVFHSGTRNMVFVNQGGGLLEPHEVDLGERMGDYYVIKKGLSVGDPVVTSANFLIDSEAQLQAAAGAFMPPPPGAGQAAAMNAPGQPQATVDFSTDPSPPHKGNNIFRVKLIGSDGTPVTGAQVVVANSMAAMPAMGMAAMRGETTLAEKGNGIYEGRGNLETGGTWQITITATKGGQIIASKHFSLNAEGGM
jgi:Cu(I)/Ag(I) efflux system membrane fusion protein/cobalt-zinc-cadmium efflux system membrane fusion protein